MAKTKKAAPAKKAAPKKAAPKKAAKKSAPKRKSAPKEVGFAGAIKERQGHYAKGYDEAYDDALPAPQLLQKAQYALTQDDRFYPPNMDNSFRESISAHTAEERLDIAMSLIAAHKQKLARAADNEKKAAKKNAKKSAPKKAAPKKAAKKSSDKKDELK